MLIAQLSDLHIRPQGQPAYRVVETNMLAERALRAMAALRPQPDCILLTGDLTDAGLPEEYAILGEMITRLISVPVFAIPGNHDKREAMIAHLPNTRHSGGVVQYVVDEFPLRLVMLDSVVPGAGHGQLGGARLRWLDTMLSEAPNRSTLIALHHPPFICGIDHMDAIALRDASAFAHVLTRHKQVKRVVCGHHHRPINVQIGSAIVSTAPSVAHQVELELSTGAAGRFVMEPPAYHLLKLLPDGSIVQHMGYVEAYPGPYPFVAS